jgi:short-subunit dehydrogenase
MPTPEATSAGAPTGSSGVKAQRPRALVTGASSGIGKAFAERLAADGYDLVVVARDVERLEQLSAGLKAAHGADVEVLPADLGDAEQLATVEARVAQLDRAAAIELLVNNAGFGSGGAFHELPIGPEVAQIQLNIVALVRLTHAALSAMVPRRSGAVINVASLGGFQPSPGVATYSATKSFVLNFTEAIHEELGKSGVSAMVLCPGFTRTEFQERAGMHATGMPNMVWQSPDQVVDTALADLRRGKAVCIPGLLNKATVSFSHLLPRVAVRKMAKVAGDRLT